MDKNTARSRQKPRTKRVGVQLAANMPETLNNYAEKQGSSITYALVGALSRGLQLPLKKDCFKNDTSPGGEQAIYRLPLDLVARLDQVAVKHRATRPAVIRGLLSRVLLARGKKPNLA